MKNIILFIIAEILDIVTTKINLTLPGVYEGNTFMAGIDQWVLVKIFVTLVICILMYRIRWKLSWLIPLVASIPFVWNFGLYLYVVTR